MRLLRSLFFAAASLATLVDVATAQAPKPYQFTVEDYARAERFLGATSNPLVSGMAGRPTWQPDGRFWYRVSAAGGGSAFMMVDPV